MTGRIWQILRFGAVGMAATALYAVLALAFGRWFGMSPVGASILAYALAAAFSYCGHKFVTFRSDGAHAQEAPKFIVVTAIGFTVAAVMPFVLTHLLGFPAWVPVALTCVLIPVLNLIVLDRWVFAARRAA